MIKCNVCKLDIKTCNYQCAQMEDASNLLKEEKTEKDALDGFCTNHTCPHNPTGFKCTLNSCILIDGKE